MTSVIVTTTGADVFSRGSASVDLTTSKVEVFQEPHATIKLSTSKVEVFATNAVPPPPVVTKLTARYTPISCVPPPRGRFRKFWATQANACPSEASASNCDDPTNLNKCSSPGLVLQAVYDPTFQELDSDGGGSYSAGNASIIGATISTDNWVAGLVLNILGTNAQQAKSICGNRPGQKGGYWLDDISGAKSGSSIRYIPTTGYTTNQQVQFVQQQAAADLNKLITYGVANTITVVATYLGGNTISLAITVIGVDEQITVVNSTMTKISNAWVWN